MQEYLNCDVIGIDIVDYGTEYVKKIIINDNKIPFEDNEFDYATFNAVLHHIPENQHIEILKEVKRTAREIIVFEDEKNILSYLFDFLSNPKEMNISLSHKRNDDWIKLFKELKFKVKSFKVKKPIYYPIKNHLFLLR